MERVVYYETHHIIPRCMGGSDDPSNLVKLTFEEHKEAHRVLCEQYPEHKGLKVAYLFMCGQTEDARKARQRLGGSIAGKITAQAMGQKYGASNGRASAHKRVGNPNLKEAGKRSGMLNVARNRMGELARLSNATRWRCQECNFIGNPGHVGRHHKKTGHKGKDKILNPDSVSTI